MEFGPKERLIRQATGREVDRVPTLGGWIGGATVLADLAGIELGTYLADPAEGVRRAYHRLGVDGLIPPVVPTTAEQIRTGLVEESRFEGTEPEALLAFAESLPDDREVRRAFDHEGEARRLREFFIESERFWKVPALPNFWDIGGHFPLYTRFGYVAFLGACALYPEAVGRIWRHLSVASEERAKILVGLYRELDLVPVMFCGEDLCNNQGPMASPDFLRTHYLPTVASIIEPLVDAGVRLVHHCDGDVRPLVDDFRAIGFSGFQGFQYECGVDIRDLRTRRSRMGEEPLIFAGLSVSRTLPFGTAEDVRDEIDHFVDATDGGRGLFVFTSNVTGVEVPAANLREAYLYARSIGLPSPRRRKDDGWPWTSGPCPRT